MAVLGEEPERRVARGKRRRGWLSMMKEAPEPTVAQAPAERRLETELPPDEPLFSLKKPRAPAPPAARPRRKAPAAKKDRLKEGARRGEAEEDDELVIQDLIPRPEEKPKAEREMERSRLVIDKLGLEDASRKPASAKPRPGRAGEEDLKRAEAYARILRDYPQSAAAVDAREALRRMSKEKEGKAVTGRRGPSSRDAIRDIPLGGAGRLEPAPVEEVEEEAPAEFAAQVAPGARPPEPKLAFIEQNIYAKVLGGRAKGALPIRFDMPARGAEYAFRKEFTGTTTPEVRLRYVRTNRSLIVLLVVALAGVAVWAVTRVRKGDGIWKAILRRS